MTTKQAILESWISRTLEGYPAEVQSQMRGSDDPFRNPVGQALKENLGILVNELLGDMRQSSVEPAIDALIRLRAVQDFSPAETVSFIFELRNIVREISGTSDEILGKRIDSLALMAFEQYMNCREQIFSLRAKEIRFRAQCAAQ